MSTRYERVKAAVKEMILNGTLKVGDRLPGERQLAATLGVSPVTAARAVNELAQDGFLRREVGVGTFVISTTPTPSEPTRVHIVLFTELDLGPEFFERDVFFGPLFRGLTTQGARNGCDFSFVFAHQFDSWKQRFIESRSPRERVILVAPPDKYLPQIEALMAYDIPLVVLGASWPDRHVPSIDCDNRLGAGLVVDHLLQLGHRRLAIVSPPLDNPNSRDRFQGMQQALLQRGRELAEANVLKIDYSPLKNVRMVEDIRRLLGQTPAPTAIFAAGYSYALGVRQALAELGLSVPGDVSLVAFDDAVSLAFMDPPLTTVQQPLVEMGAAAIDFVMGAAGTHGQLRGTQPFIHHFEPELVVRRSTGPPGDPNNKGG